MMANLLSRLRSKEIQLHRCTLPAVGSSSFLPPLPKRATYIQRFLRRLKKSTLISEFNPLSMEYFRSRAEILRIKQEHVRSKSWIIHPFSDFRAFYEMWMALIWFFVIWYMPADAAFDLLHPKGENNTLLVEHVHPMDTHHNGLTLFVQLVCLLDIALTLCTGYSVEKRRKVVMDPVKIIKHYVVSLYFLTDLLCSIPLTFFFSHHGEQRLMSMLGFFRIIRLTTLYSYISRTADMWKLRHITVDVTKNVIINYLIFHWFACFHYMIPQIRYFLYGEIIPESWLERSDLNELDLLSKYIVCIYRATGNLFCINFEETQVDVWEEKLVTILTFIFGKVYVFYITVLILNQLLRQRSLEIMYFETISQVQAYMSQKQLSMSMQTRLLQFYDYKYNKKFFKERNISTLLSEKLRGEINLNVCSKLVQNVSLLAHLPQQHLEQVVINLKPEIYLANDIIIKAGSVGDCMYFLASGTVGVWTPSGKEVCHLQDGAYFGEISLVFKDKRRTANIVAVEICEVYKLDRKAFRNIFKASSELFKMLEDVANERMEITQMFEDVHAKTFMELSTTHK